MTIEATLPGQAVPVERMPGHWLLAGLGKRVLRPGGRELTDHLLGALAITTSDDVVELAPGLGSTTDLVLASEPKTYVGVDRDPTASARIADVVTTSDRRIVNSSAADTGLADDSADVVFGEAYLTMQPASQKKKILTELARITRPGGRLGIHEIAFTPDDLDAETRDAIRDQMTGAIKVHVSPLSSADWTQLLDHAGFEVREKFTAPLSLLEPRRLIADEGVMGAARFVTNVVRRTDARKRVVAMRRAMGTNSAHMQAVSLIAVRRQDS